LLTRRQSTRMPLLLTGSLAPAGVQEFGDEPDRRVAAGGGERLVLVVGGFGGAAGQPPAADDVQVLLPPSRPWACSAYHPGGRLMVDARRPQRSNRAGSLRPRRGRSRGWPTSCRR